MKTKKYYCVFVDGNTTTGTLIKTEYNLEKHEHFLVFIEKTKDQGVLTFFKEVK